MDRCALFVDAGYLLADGAMAVHGTRHRETVSWDFGGLLQLLGNLARERTGMPLLRCYWYESTVEGRRAPEHEALADLPGLKLRLGRIRPGRREGVDTEIHRDLMALARNGAVADAIVVSGDEDLASVITDAQDLGLRITVVHVAVDGNWTISRVLRQECDDLIEIGSGHLRPYVTLLTGLSNGNSLTSPLTNGNLASPLTNGSLASPLTNGNGSSVAGSISPLQSSGPLTGPLTGPPPSSPINNPLTQPQPQLSAPTLSASALSNGSQSAYSRDPLLSGSGSIQGTSGAQPIPQAIPPQPQTGPLPQQSGPSSYLSPSAPSSYSSSPPSSYSGGSPSSYSGESPSSYSGGSPSSYSGNSPSSYSSGSPSSYSGNSPSSYSGESPSSYSGTSYTSPASSAPSNAYATPQQMAPAPLQQSTPTLSDAVKAAHQEGQDFGESVARDAPALWLEAVLARKPRMPSDLEARLLQGSQLPIDFLLHDEVRHALRRGFWDALERSRR